MSDRIYLVILILVLSGLLMLALKSGFIGGVGTGSYRDRNPIPFWAGVAVTAFAELLLIAALISSLI